ncbi:Glycine--tRNA ligase 1, mitochondrial [Nowakowskiella sp. JEL0078]|nr:Glycine--tRNA ligase 1, mitochondrial [Nowakowskiella sp. JEL0078]
MQVAFYDSQEVHTPEAAVNEQVETICAFKPSSVSKETLGPEVAKLKSVFKSNNNALANRNFDRSALDAVLTRRFFFAPSFQIYGGVAGFFDYGPSGCALQNNILDVWRKHFVLEEDMLEIDCTNITTDNVFKTSGHVDRFADWIVRDSITREIFRQDHLVKQVLKQRLEDSQILSKAGANAAYEKKRLKIKGNILDDEIIKEYENLLESLDNYQGPELFELMNKFQIVSPETGNPLTEPVIFNLMFDCQIGPTGKEKGYLRPETAQGHFLNFKKLLEFNSNRMPFASASVGKSFRNEISPRGGLLRLREFTIAEIEHFVDPLNKQHLRFNEIRSIVLPLYSSQNQINNSGIIHKEIGEAVDEGMVNNETLGYFMARIYLFLVRIGIDKNRIRFRQHLSNEMAHYATDCWDAEIESSSGWIECVGCADRSAYDLTAHSKATNEKLIVREPLPKPIYRTSWVLSANGKILGPKFKNDVSKVKDYFLSLKNDDDTWNSLELINLKRKLELGKGRTLITTNNFSFEITSEMLTIEQKTEKISIREFTPNVIEPSFGIGRIIHSLIEHVYWVRNVSLNEEKKEPPTVLSFPPIVAPYKCLIVPLSNQDVFIPYIKETVSELRRLGLSSRIDDSAGSIGRRYARSDEIGIPFGVTVDFQTLKDGTVTLRERDSTNQIRESTKVISRIINDLCTEQTTWAEVEKTYPIFVSQDV